MNKGVARGIKQGHLNKEEDNSKRNGEIKFRCVKAETGGAPPVELDSPGRVPDEATGMKERTNMEKRKAETAKHNLLLPSRTIGGQLSPFHKPKLEVVQITEADLQASHILEIEAVQTAGLECGRKKGRIYFHLDRESCDAIDNLNLLGLNWKTRRKALRREMMKLLPEAVGGVKVGCPDAELDKVDLHIDVRLKPEAVAKELEKYAIKETEEAPTPAPGAEQATQAV